MDFVTMMQTTDDLTKLKPDHPDDDAPEEVDFLSIEELREKDALEAKHTSTLTWMANTVGDIGTRGIVYSTGVFLGCLAAAELAPQLAPAVVSWVFPASRVQSAVLVGATQASVTVATYGAAKEVGSFGAKTALSLASNALSYAWNGGSNGNANTKPKPVS